MFRNPESQNNFLYAADDRNKGNVYGKNTLRDATEIKPPEVNKKISSDILEEMGFKVDVEYSIEVHKEPHFDKALFPDVKEFQFVDVQTGKALPNARLIETKQYRVYINAEKKIQVIEGIPYQATVKGALDELPDLQIAASGIPMITESGESLPQDWIVLVNVYGLVGGDGAKSRQAQQTGEQMDSDHGRLLVQGFSKFRGFVFSPELVAYGSDARVDTIIFMMTQLLRFGGYYLAYVPNEKPERTLERAKKAAEKKTK